MSRNIGFRNSGFRELDRKLEKLARGVPEEKKRAALHEGAGLIVVEAKRLVPVDTGLLQDSIAVADDRDARIYGKVNALGVSVYVGPVGSVDDGDVYYARFIEFGTVFMTAQPFMRPAIASERPKAEQLVLRRLAGNVLELAR